MLPCIFQIGMATKIFNQDREIAEIFGMTVFACDPCAYRICQSFEPYMF